MKKKINTARKRKFRVSWNQITCCSSIVEAATEEEAITLATEGDPDQTCDGGNEDVGCEEVADED